MSGLYYQKVIAFMTSKNLIFLEDLKWYNDLKMNDIKMGTPAFELLRSIYDIANISIKLNYLKHHRKLCVYFENGDTAQRIRVFEEELHPSGAYQWTPEIKKLFERYDNEMNTQGESRNGNN